MRRSRVLTSLIAVASLAPSAVLLLGTPGAGADTANPEPADEAWFARYRPENPVIDTCVPGTTTIGTTTAQPCGPVQTPAPYSSPQSKQTGHYVVSSAGGDTGDGAASGDTGWAAFSWDMSPYQGATVTKFIVTLTQANERVEPSTGNPRNQGDTWSQGQQIFIQACNIFEGWGGEPGPNPWDARPKEESRCVAPTITGRKFTFDVTSFAQSWTEGEGYGIVVRPGTPTVGSVQPFQITFAGTHDEFTMNTPPTSTPQKVTFEYLPAVEEEFDDDFGSIDGGGDEFFEDITTSDGGTFEAMPDLDIIPTDVGSEELTSDTEGVAEAVAGGESELTAPSTSRRTRPISTDTGFPWLVLLLLPLAALAFWGTGTALGPMGDPVPARAGGVTRVLAERHVASRGTDPR